MKGLGEEFKEKQDKGEVPRKQKLKEYKKQKAGQFGIMDFVKEAAGGDV